MSELTYRRVAAAAKERFGQPYSTTSSRTGKTAAVESMWDFMHDTATRAAMLRQGKQYNYKEGLGEGRLRLGAATYPAEAAGYIPGVAVSGGEIESGAEPAKFAKRAKTAMGGDILYFENLPRQAAAIAPQFGAAPVINVMPTAVLLGRGYLPSGQSYYNPEMTGHGTRTRSVSITLPEELPEGWEPGIKAGQSIALHGGWFDVAPGMRGRVAAAESFTPSTWGIEETWKQVGTRKIRDRTLVMQGEADYAGHIAMKLYGSKTGAAPVPNMTDWGITFKGQRVDVAHLTEGNEPAQLAYAISATWDEKQMLEAFGGVPKSWEAGMSKQVWSHLQKTGQIGEISWRQWMYLGPESGGYEPQLKALMGKGAAKVLYEQVEDSSLFGVVQMTGYGYTGPVAQLGKINWPYRSRQVSGEELRKTDQYNPERGQAIRGYSERYRNVAANIAGAQLAAWAMGGDHRTGAGSCHL